MYKAFLTWVPRSTSSWKNNRTLFFVCCFLRTYPLGSRPQPTYYTILYGICTRGLGNCGKAVPDKVGFSTKSNTSVFEVRLDAHPGKSVGLKFIPNTSDSFRFISRVTALEPTTILAERVQNIFI